MILLALSGPQLFGTAMVVIGIVVAGFTGRYAWRATGIYRATAVEALTEAAAGDLVRITGTILEGPDEHLSAPFSGQPCQAIRYAVEERRLSPMGLPWFVTIHETAGSVPFRVRTDVAEIDVQAPARTVTLERRVVATVPTDEVPPDRIDRFERETDGVPGVTIWRSPPNVLRPIARALSLGTRRYTEQRVGTSEEVTVVGRVRGGAVEPLVVSDRSPLTTAVRMAKTSLVGFAIGVGAIAFGVALIAFV